MEVDEELMVRSNMNEEKVILMQKRFEEEDKSIKELKKKNDAGQEEEMLKTKNSLRLKKKNKKKSNQNKANFAETDKVATKEIPVKYDSVLKEEGIDRSDYCIYGVKPDGACGSTCTGLHCHKDKKLGKYVRRNIIEYLVQFGHFFSHILYSQST
jgi:hypothetical protein